MRSRGLNEPMRESLLGARKRSEYGPVTRYVTRSFFTFSRMNLRTASLSWCGFSFADAGPYSMSVPYSEGKKDVIESEASASCSREICKRIAPRPRAEITVSYP